MLLIILHKLRPICWLWVVVIVISLLVLCQKQGLKESCPTCTILEKQNRFFVMSWLVLVFNFYIKYSAR